MSASSCPRVLVLMAGGRGTRLWPLSTKARAKQFVPLIQGKSLFRLAFERAEALFEPDHVYVVTGRDQVEEVARQLPEVDPSRILEEPFRRDTAGAVSLTVETLARRFSDAVVFLSGTDYLIEPQEQFRASAEAALEVAKDHGTIVCLGIEPTRPATQFGYLSPGERVPADASTPSHRLLEAFVEKPDRETAKGFLEAGYLWNSGMFAFRLGPFRRVLQQHIPGHLELLGEVPSLPDGRLEPQGLAAAMEEMPRISIDFAVMEKTQGLRLVPASFEWKDLGGWEVLAEELPEGPLGNRVQGRAFALEASENLVFCEDPGEEVALLGVDNLVVVRAGRRTLIAHRSQLSKIKQLVQGLEEAS